MAVLRIQGDELVLYLDLQNLEFFWKREVNKKTESLCYP